MRVIDLPYTEEFDKRQKRISELMKQHNECVKKIKEEESKMKDIYNELLNILTQNTKEITGALI